MPYGRHTIQYDHRRKPPLVGPRQPRPVAGEREPNQRHVQERAHLRHQHDDNSRGADERTDRCARVELHRPEHSTVQQRWYGGERAEEGYTAEDPGGYLRRGSSRRGSSLGVPYLSRGVRGWRQGSGAAQVWSRVPRGVHR